MVGQAHSGTLGLRFQVGHECRFHLGFSLGTPYRHRRAAPRSLPPMAQRARDGPKDVGSCRRTVVRQGLIRRHGHQSIPPRLTAGKTPGRHPPEGGIGP